MHMVLSPRSRGIIGAEDIARMKQGRHSDQHLARPFDRRVRPRRRSQSRQDHCGAGRLRQRAATSGPSFPRFRPYRAYAPSRIRSGGDMARFLSSERRECRGLSGWQTYSGFERAIEDASRRAKTAPETTHCRASQERGHCRAIWPPRSSDVTFNEGAARLFVG